MCMCTCVHMCLVMPDSFETPWMQPTSLFCPWDFPSKNTGVGCHFLLQGIFLTQGSNLHLLHQQLNSLLLVQSEKPWRNLERLHTLRDSRGYGISSLRTVGYTWHQGASKISLSYKQRPWGSCCLVPSLLCLAWDLINCLQNVVELINFQSFRSP